MVLSMERWVGKVAIVTGASSGIGATVAEKLVEEGLLVVGWARRSELIDEMAKNLAGKKGKLYSVKVNMSNEQEILNAFKWTTENLGPVHILVNNAGVHFKDTLWNGNTELWKETLEVNVLGLCIATREAIKIMRENNIDGHIIHMNSICGHTVIHIPNLDIYPGTKFAVTALAETLRLELNSLKSKIKITNLSPGAVDTPIFNKADKEKENFDAIFTSFLKTEDVADAVVYVLSTPPHVQIQELIIKPVNEAF